MKNQTLIRIKRIKKYLSMQHKEWEKRGLDDYSDLEKFQLKTDLGDKEIARCQFLLEMIEEIELRTNDILKQDETTK
jgi:hypothetical protein